MIVIVNKKEKRSILAELFTSLVKLQEPSDK